MMAQAFKKIDSQIDTSVKIPDAVLRHAAAADEAQKRFVEELNAQPEGGEPQPQPTPQPIPPQPEPEPPKPEPPKPETRNWEDEFHRLSSRAGRDQQQLRALTEQVSNLTRALEAEKTRKTEVVVQQPYAKLVTDEEREGYGEDFLDVVKRAAREEFEPVKRQYDGEIERLKAVVRGVGAQVEVMSEQEMYASMERAYPGWHVLNCSDSWKDWLARPDAFDGQRRLDKLRQQWGLRNVPNVLNFVGAYLNEEAALDPARGQEEPLRLPAPAGSKVPLETFAAPGRAKSAAASSAPSDKPFYTREFIEQFYKDVALGHWRGRDQERIAIDHDIMSAEREGRIQQSRSRY